MPAADGQPGGYAVEVRRAHAEAYRAFLLRVREEQAKIARLAERARAAAIEELGSDASPADIARGVERRIREGQHAIGEQVDQAIERAPEATRRRLSEVRVNLGARPGDRPEALPASLLRAGERQRARTAATVVVTGQQRFRARTDAETRSVMVDVRAGLERGASIRAITRQIETATPHGPEIPQYVTRVVEALRGGVPDAELRRLSADVREQARRLGSATDTFRTIQPAVVRLARAVESGNRDMIQRRVDEFVGRKMRYEASRIARTEAARASTRAQIESARDTPGVTALEWRLSDAHPVDDICDVFAEADLYGLGPGRYPLDDAPELPAHPQCLCTLVPVITEASILRSLRGEPPEPRGTPAHASPEEWLRAQPPEVQARIVGRGNAERMRNGETVIGRSGAVLPLGR